ncbi:hypothetical protein DFQ26_008778 [Actinomortierella ambigua]|nr:hypothetical protein DFQ26_008778 [Actinomortierella ambigua]
MTITILREAPSFEGTQVRFTEQGVSAIISPTSDLIKHPGTLTITDECLYFHSPESAAGLAIPYPAIIIHATARESPFGPSIYCQIEGSLPQSSTGNIANGSADGQAEEEDEDDSLLEIYFVPPRPNTLDSIYENLSYCVSLHPDGDADDFEDDEDMYEDDEEDHDALFMEADIQGGYTPRHTGSTAASSIGHPITEADQAPTVSDAVPAIDIHSGEWYTGNPESDAKFELSEEGKVIHPSHRRDSRITTTITDNNNNMNISRSQQKRTRTGEDSPQDAKDNVDQNTGHNGGDMAVDHEQHNHRLVDDEEEAHQLGRSKMWRANLDRMEKMLQDPHHLLKDDATPNPDDDEPGEDAEEDRFKNPTSS